MSVQQQDLVYFDDNSLVSNSILEESHNLLHIISYSEGTAPTWLVNSLVENSLVGTANTINRDLNKKVPSRALVIYVSFSQNESLVLKSCRKNGLDLENTTGFQFVDCFSQLFTKEIPNPTSAGAHIKKIFENIKQAIQKDKGEKKVVIIEKVELLLAATDLTSNELNFLLLDLNRLCNLLIVVIDTSSALVNLHSVEPSDPVFKITDFYVKLHHKSSLNVSLLPLSTGKAKDITGCLAVAKGAVPPGNRLAVMEKEYVYHVTKEGSVKLFFR